MSLDLTRGQIIEEGLSQAGRPDLVSNARLWLNVFLEEQYANQDWNWLVKNSDGLAVVHGGTLPLDYRATKSAQIVVNGVAKDLRTIDNAAEYDSLRASLDDSPGIPQFLYLNREQNRTYFVPTPQAGLTWNLAYFYMPDIPPHTLAATDLDSVVWGLPYSILVEHIKFKAMEYNDDSRAEKAEMQIEKKIIQSKVNSHDRRGGKSQIPLGKSFRKRF